MTDTTMRKNIKTVFRLARQPTRHRRRKHDGWKIGRINIGDFTKEGLLEQASKERRSAVGHLRNTQFYEALAAPLQPGQVTRDYWSKEAFAA